MGQRKNLTLRSDRFGNLLIELKSRSRLPRWVFTAHTDHPGFVAQKMLDPHRLKAAFRGWVKVEFVRGTACGFLIAVVRFAARSWKRPWRITISAVPHEVIVRVDRPVTPGSPGMFDQGVGRYRGGKFLCRACDDLAARPRAWKCSTA